MADDRTDEPEGAQVFVLPRAGRDYDPLVKRPEQSRFCRHIVYEVHVETRVVTCLRCGSTLDPFQVLFEYAEKQRAWRNAELLERQTHARIRELEAQERKIKARTRSAKRKDANAAVADERKRTHEKLKGAAWKAREIARLAQHIARTLGAEVNERELELVRGEESEHA